MSAYRGRTVKNKSALREQTRKIKWLKSVAIDKDKTEKFLLTVPEDVRPIFRQAFIELLEKDSEENKY